MSTELIGIIGTSTGVLIGAVVTLFTKKYEVSAIKQSNDIQLDASNRLSRQFVANKRQDWINDMRLDFAKYFVLTREQGWKWEARYGVAQRRIIALQNEPERLEAFLEQHSKENGQLDSEVRELEYKIKLRLNPHEEHDDIRSCLSNVRGILDRYSSVGRRFSDSIAASEEFNKLNDEMFKEIIEFEKFVAKMLKAEWEKVKLESAGNVASIEKR